MLITEKIINDLSAQEIIDMSMLDATRLKDAWKQEVREGKR